METKSKKTKNKIKYIPKVNLDELERRLINFDEGKATSDDRDQLLNWVLQAVEPARRNNGKIIIDKRVVKILTLFDANVLGGGGLQKMQPEGLQKYFEYMNTFYSWNRSESEFEEAIDDAFNAYKAVLKKEVKIYAEKANNNSKDKNSDSRESMFWELMGNAFTLEHNTDLFEPLCEILKKEFDIDLKSGKGISKKLPYYNFAEMVFSLGKSYVSTESRLNPDLEDTLLGIIDLDVKDLVEYYKDEDPENILLSIPVIMELHNLVAYEGFEDTGIRYPLPMCKSNIEKILSHIKSDYYISDDDKSFMHDCSKKYMSEFMPRETFKRYLQIYLKMLSNKIGSGKPQAVNLMEYSDMILGQICMDNPIFKKSSKDYIPINKERLLRLLYYDFAKDLADTSLPSEKYRITMGDEILSVGYAGSHSRYYKEISIVPSGDSIPGIIDTLNTIFHEVKHAIIDYDCKTKVYKGALDYVGNKVLFLRREIDDLVVNGKFNYDGAPYEISARYAGTSGAISFINRHGLDKSLLKGIIRAHNRDLQIAQSFDILDNPRVWRRQEERKNIVLDFKKGGLRTYFRRGIKEKIFDKKLYRYYKADLRWENYNKKKRGYYPISWMEGRKINPNRFFHHEVVKKYPEVYEEGSYFSIEYDKNGKRRPLSDLLTFLSDLDEKPENDPEREVIEYVINNGVIKDDVPAKAFNALLNYKSTNPKNDKIVQEVVQKYLLQIVKGMDRDFFDGNVDALAMEYLTKGYRAPYYKVEGYSSGDLTSAVINQILGRCYDESQAIDKRELKEFSPFIKGVYASAPLTPDIRRRLRKNGDVTVLESLKIFQDQVIAEQVNIARSEVAWGYVVSVKDIAQMTFGPSLKKAGKAISSFLGRNKADYYDDSEMYDEGDGDENEIE